MTVRYRRDFSIVELIRQAIHHYLLLPYNYPQEGMRCIPLLFQAVELLMKNILDIHKEDWTSAKELINKLEHEGALDDSGKTALHTLRKRRNRIVHRGELSWESFPAGKYELESIFPIVGDLCRRREIDLEGNLSIASNCVLRGDPIPWYAMAEDLSTLAKTYVAVDLEVAVDVANAAFEKAVRGLASSWRVPDAETPKVPDLMEKMWEHDHEFAHPQYWDEAVKDARDRYREPRVTSPSDAPERFGLDRPLRLNEIPSHYPGLRNPETAVRNYLNEVWDLVQDYLRRFPLLKLEKCMRESWNGLAERMEAKYPEVQVPRTSHHLWEENHFTRLEVSIPYDDPSAEPEDNIMAGSTTPSSLWEGEALDFFKRLLVETCGDLPPGLKL